MILFFFAALKNANRTAIKLSHIDRSKGLFFIKMQLRFWFAFLIENFPAYLFNKNNETSCIFIE